MWERLEVELGLSLEELCAIKNVRCDAALKAPKSFLVENSGDLESFSFQKQTQLDKLMANNGGSGLKATFTSGVVDQLDDIEEGASYEMLFLKGGTLNSLSTGVNAQGMLASMARAIEHDVVKFLKSRLKSKYNAEKLAPELEDETPDGLFLSADCKTGKYPSAVSQMKGYKAVEEKIWPDYTIVEVLGGHFIPEEIQRKAKEDGVNVLLREGEGLYSCGAAARGGQLNVLRWMRGQRSPCPWEGGFTSIQAASGGHIELQWLQNQTPAYARGPVTLLAAAECGQLETVQWLRAQQPPCEWDVSVCRGAAQFGQIVLKRAVLNRQVEVVRWLMSHEPPCLCDAWVCHYLAQHGDRELLRWVRAQHPPAPWTSSACLVAAANGDLRTLQCLRGLDPPCPWGESVCRIAAEQGKWQVLRWLQQEPPCPCSAETLQLASENLDLSVVQEV
ncbi:hypothetical protein B484DRAFT_389169 [Ochromonadaceae sp. CCMP2298]|nr:hypothetical protein B484DRAFT_389169 [Ochromonadaceae sp. CCMP2298]